MKSAMTCHGVKKEIFNKSVADPSESAMKYPGAKNEISNESTRHPNESAMKYQFKAPGIHMKIAMKYSGEKTIASICMWE